MNKKIEEAKKLFSNSANCSQSTLAVFAEELGLARHQAISIGAGFGAGICFQGKTCGAVTGAYMALGLKSGIDFHEPEMIKEHTYQLIKSFNKKFEAIYGTTECKELLGIDLSKPEGIEMGKEMGLFTTKCPFFVEDAVKIVDKIINKNDDI